MKRQMPPEEQPPSSYFTDRFEKIDIKSAPIPPMITIGKSAGSSKSSNATAARATIPAAIVPKSPSPNKVPAPLP
jgi:hypothetical protein